MWAHRDVHVGGHLHRDVLRKLAELLAARHKVGLAVHLCEHPQARAGVDVRHDEALGGDAGALFVGGREALVAQEDDGGLVVTAALHERLLAVHHAGARGGAEVLDEGGGDGGALRGAEVSGLRLHQKGCQPDGDRIQIVLGCWANRGESRMGWARESAPHVAC